MIVVTCMIITFSSGDAFRFSHFRTKNGQLHESRYPTADGNLTAGRTQKKPPAKKKGKRSKAKMVVSASRAEAVQETSAPTAAVGNMEAGPPVLVAGAQESGNSVDGHALAIINYRQMTLLANSGVTRLMSITGPNQGSPTFVVPQSLVTRLQQLEDSTLIPKTTMISSTPDCVLRQQCNDNGRQYPKLTRHDRPSKKRKKKSRRHRFNCVGLSEEAPCDKG